MKRLLPLLFAFLMLLQPVSAFNALEKLDQNGTYLYIYVRGDSSIKRGIPPWNPLNDSSIQKFYLVIPYNKTHVRSVIYYPNGSKTEKIRRYYPRTPRVPFNLSDWNLSKILEEYQWGVENYLPNVTGEHWYKGYWNSSIARWEVELNATTFKVILDGGHCGECEQYITFECWRNGTNVNCQWGKPIMRDITPPWTPKNTTTSTTKEEENTICGPVLLIGLSLIPALKRRKSQKHKR